MAKKAQTSKDKIKTVAKTVAKAETKAKAKTVTKAKAKAVTKAKAKTETKAKAKPKEKVKAKGKDKTKVKRSSKKEEDEEEIEIVDEDLEEEEEEEEKEYLVKQKPELTPEIKKQLRKRREAKSKKPKFKRQEWFRYKRLGDAWRKPRGLHSKLRTNRKYRINKVRVGYKTPETVRGLHSSGFKEKLVYNRSDLENINPKIEAARIGHSVSTKKRIDIEEHADELGIRVLNRG